MENWQGPETLVLAFDIGTTLSAASVAHLVQNMPVTVKNVSKWPGSPKESKIPSVVLYGEDGRVRALGAETLDDADLDEEESLSECKWFKLHLHPIAMQPPSYEALTREAGGGAVLEGPSSFEVPPLPPNVSIQQVYTDFIKYLFENTKAWFEATAPDGDVIWKKLGNKNLKLVLAHPNSWDLDQQAILKRAVIRSGVIAAEAVEDSVVFVTESEASVHFATRYSSGQKNEWLSRDAVFAVVDAGGSTVDTCVYSVATALPKLELHEAKASDCSQSGAIFVSRAAEEIIKAKLGNSKFNTPEFVEAMVQGFDTKTKLVFDSVTENYLIKFGFDRDTDKAVGIVRGRLTLTGAEVRRAFDPCVSKIIESIREQITGLNVKAILLGFGESPYLQRRLRETFEVPESLTVRGLRVVTADESSKKAVAEGASLFYAVENVVSRYTKVELGTRSYVPWKDYKDVAGLRTGLTLPDGNRWIDWRWVSIVPRGSSTDKDAVFRSSFVHRVAEGDPYVLKTPIISYEGDAVDARSASHGWCKDAQSSFCKGFRECCTVTADLSALAAKTPTVTNEHGKRFKMLANEICILPGRTSLAAQVRWTINGVEYVGPAKIIPPAFY